MTQPGSAYSLDKREEKPETHTMTVLVDNEPGVLARVIGLFSGRGYNIEVADRVGDRARSPSVAHHHRHLGAAHGDRADPASVGAAGSGSFGHRLDGKGNPIERELAMVKVAGKGEKRVEALRLAEAFRAQVIDASTEHFVFEITGKQSKIEQFIALMQPLGLVEVARTGLAAIARGPERM